MAGGVLEAVQWRQGRGGFGGGGGGMAGWVGGATSSATTVSHLGCWASTLSLDAGPRR